jgi:cellulose synthase/poly-beta-1,6-N-acetylglucosamine synthase-like glycosyltransferase
MWQLMLWGSCAIIFYTYFGYPALLYLMGKLRKRRIHSGVNHPELPSVCLIISAFNEERVIGNKIQNSLSQRYPADKLTVLVASDGSTDRTCEIVEEFADYGVELVHNDNRRGKSAVLNDVIRARTEDIIVFTDANSLLSGDAVGKLARRFDDPEIGCVIGRLRYVEREASSVGKGEGAYWRYEGLVSRLESGLHSVLVANGPIFAIRRELFRQLYPEVANDFQIPIDIADGGHGVVYAPEAEAVEHTTVFWREEFRRKVRIVLRGLTGFSALRRRMRGFRLWQFTSHKLLRWMVGPFLIAAFVSNAVLATTSTVYAGLFALQLLFYLAALIGSFLRHVENPKKIFYVPFYFTMVNAAALVGITKFLGGQRLRVWEKAESTRLTPVEPLTRDTVSPPEKETRGAGHMTSPRSVNDNAGKAPGPRAKVAKN